MKQFDTEASAMAWALRGSPGLRLRRAAGALVLLAGALALAVHGPGLLL